MLDINGNFCKDCKIFTDNIEEEALSMVYKILSNPVFKDSKIRIMPDTHAGKGIVIGFTCPVGNYVNPSHVGVDIGCGIESIFFENPLSEDKYAIFEHRLKTSIPTGFNQNETTIFNRNDLYNFLNNEIQKAYQSSNGKIDFIEFSRDNDIEKWCQHIGMDITTFYHSIGTLGGGNHFLEYDESYNHYAFTVHTGSRNLGQKVHNYWAKIANGPSFDKNAFNLEVKEFVKNWNGNKEDIPNEINKIRSKPLSNIHNSYLSNDNLKGYLTDMVICQAYAKYNRKVILDKAANIMNEICNGNKVIDHISTTHNYIDFGDMILRKGAIRSYSGEKMIIPFNMRDGIAICEGKSNEDWNCSAPHGSGRAMSRSKAKQDINIEDFKEQMKGIYSTSVGISTLDEAPDAYKPTNEIIENIKDTCNVLFFMKPKINIKDSSNEECD